MVNYLCVSDPLYKIRIQVFGFHMPVTYTEQRNDIVSE